MTDKKPKKEKPNYDIEYLRRATVDAEYNFCEFRVKFDPSKLDSRTVVNDTEKMVGYVRELTAAEAPKTEKPKPEKKVSKKTSPVKEESSEDDRIADFEDGAKKLNLSVCFIGEVGDVRSFTKADGTKGMLCKIPVKDEAGDTIALTAWDSQTAVAQQIKQNAWVALQGAYVTEYKGTLELNVGNWSKMEVVYNG